MIEYKVRVYSNGTKFWCLNGDNLWYLNDKEYTEQEYLKALNPVKELTVSEISDLLGYDVKIVK